VACLNGPTVEELVEIQLKIYRFRRRSSIATGLSPDMSLTGKHPRTDVAGELPDSFFAHLGILCKARHEGMARNIQPVIEATLGLGAVVLRRASIIDAPNVRLAVIGDSDMIIRKHRAARERHLQLQLRLVELTPATPSGFDHRDIGAARPNGSSQRASWGYSSRSSG
jgi:hypothetical protein